MKNLTVIAFLLALTISLSACSSNTTSSYTDSSSETVTTTSYSSSIDIDDMFTENDLDSSYDEDSSTKINLDEVTDSTVTITEAGTYILSGMLEDGMVIVEADKTDKIKLVLNNVEINNSSSASIYVISADKVFITLAEDSINALSNTGEYVQIDDNNIDSVIFSKEDLTINGTGTLKINSEYGHGIVSKDDLVLADGTYEINSEGHGIQGKDSVRIADGNYLIVSGKDGIHAENADDEESGFLYIENGYFDITSDGDGLSSSLFIRIEGGEYDIESGGGDTGSSSNDGFGMDDFDGFKGGGRESKNESSDMGNSGEMELPEDMEQIDELDKMERPERNEDGNQAESQNEKVYPNDVNEIADNTTDTTDLTSSKGIKATSEITINAGTFELDCADDGIHSNGNITINDGTYNIKSGDDGIHADSIVMVINGEINISDSYEGIEGIEVNITGGYISIVSSDDGINAAGGNDSSGFGRMNERFTEDSFSEDGISESVINISGGTIYINANGDGIDSNGNIVVSGGETYISGPSNSGNGALDYATSATITGGIFVASGASGMAMNFSDDSAQCAMLVSVDSENIDTEITVTLTDGEGNVLISYDTEKSFNSILISCPELTEDGTYILKVNDTEKEITMNGIIYSDIVGNMNQGGFNRGNKNNFEDKEIFNEENESLPGGDA